VHLAYPLPWWLAVVLAASVGAAAVVQYRRPLAPLTPVQRGVLVSFRVLTLGVLVIFLFRPIAVLPASTSRDTVVPVLLDASRSMRIADADNQTRLARAVGLIRTDILPALDRKFRIELFTIGDAPVHVDAGSLDHAAPSARRTDLRGALDSIRDRYRAQRVAGVVLLSDGGDTGAAGRSQASEKTNASVDSFPVYAIGIGSPEIRDREVLGVTAGDPRIDRASIDVHVSAVSHGFGRDPFTLRLLANGKPVDSRRIVPGADGSPVDELFTVSPELTAPTVYTAEIPLGEDETVSENNSRSVLVSPAGRKRRVLVVEGAPGFEHSFMTRAWAGDPGLEVDVVTRKGRNAEGQDTYFVQAGPGRTAALTTGFPERRDALFTYDALVIANVEGDHFTRAQLALGSDFVSERGGGLLVMGGRSFAQRGLSGTPLEEALPVELNDRRGGVVRTSMSPADIVSHNRMSLTPDGELHPMMRLAASPEETRKLWSALPALAASAPLGGPRPGAKVLALTTAPGGGTYPVVAVQRYGQGRSMIFAGEASWRWKMMAASTDRSYEIFWRQAARWLSAESPDPIAITAPAAAEPGDPVTLSVEARDGSFVPVPDAAVEASLTSAGADAVPLKFRRADPSSARFTTGIEPERTGLYRVRVEARRGSTSLGTADRWFYVGGADREFSDPRLNESFLRRIARTTGGRYVRPAEASHLTTWMESAVPQNAVPERRDLWHEPWAFGTIVLLLSAEWILRRRWGLR
jgi:uncharacterized membrane protein